MIAKIIKKTEKKKRTPINKTKTPFNGDERGPNPQILISKKKSGQPLFLWVKKNPIMVGTKREAKNKFRANFGVI